ncbi:DUF2262 domain-containing protein [Rhodopirellula halodulae]|uniref:DUF2262 domain-containing protein n=1 Tax=Rhodopirellula halodulae TaxID=2894198 RepID=UPI001E4FE817|nr:DUF2262 domain-containing protein [Rhodopirellula sp. JC737]MCC9656720.1 DUF2262 domain-containing protein [Rhodopirellula sp. JC737]
MLDQIVELIGDIFPAGDDSQPVEFQDSRFGRLIFRDEYSWFEGSFELPETGDTVDLFLDSAPEAPNQASIDRAKQITDEWPQRRSTILARITDNLLDLYNKEWRKLDESDEGPLDAGRFSDRLSLCSLAIDSEQFVTLGFHADGMFTDHGVTATVSTEDEIDAWVD